VGLILKVTDSTPPCQHSFSDLSVGQQVTQSVTFDWKTVEAFVDIYKDYARIHQDEAFARDLGYPGPILHGFLVSGRFSRLIGMYLPGEGAVLQTIDLKFRRPVMCGNEVVYRLSISRLRPAHQIIEMDLTVMADGLEAVTGQCQCVLK
jgi:3-hydroxybutyryl-CoA dehydratase